MGSKIGRGRADRAVRVPAAYHPPVDHLDLEPGGAEAPRTRAPIGSLGRAMVAMQSRVQTITLVVTTVVAIVVAATLIPPLALPLGDALGTPLALLILGVLCWAVFVLAVAIIAVLPPLLLPGRDRAVFAAHSWIGAREVRRTLGRATRTTGLPSDASSAEAWLARNPVTDRIGTVRVDALVMAGRFDDARSEAGRLPERSPLEAYRKAEALALIDDQTGGIVDEDALRAAVAAIPVGLDRTEAAASLAVFRARRALPDGDWRAPLLEVRPAIPGSDLRVLLFDFGLPIFEILVRKTVVPFTVILLIIGLWAIVSPGLLP
jgi:hypothetical protein